ncbi:MAG: nicotinate phosphoribosyltransferase [Pirellulales bacterium]
MNPAASALLTDLYQLTMLQGYYEQGMEETATFELFARRLPPARNFLLAAGLEEGLDYLESLRFTSAELEWLAGCGRFRREFVDYLERFRFTGEVRAMAEGTVFFAEEPILQVTAPLPQAQFVESRLLNLLHFQTMIASKAARAVLAARGRFLVDFGMRRAHGAEAGLLAARASHLAGFAGTATVLAGMLYGIPLFGTMAHSFIQAQDDEAEAFARFARANPGNVVFLLDTYDTEAAARKVVAIAGRLSAEGIAVQAVRLDSGDLAEHARRVRRILDEGGLRNVKILASGDLDEYAVRALLAADAPIDGFGIGTRLDTSADAPSLDFVYKLVEYAGRPRRKRSSDKATWPGRKQVYRAFGKDGRALRDVVALDRAERKIQGTKDEVFPSVGPLLQPVMKDGRRLAARPPLAQMPRRVQENLARLPLELRSLDECRPYPVEIHQELRDLARELDQQ